MNGECLREADASRFQWTHLVSLPVSHGAIGIRPVTHGAGKPAVDPVRALTAIRGLAAWWVVAFHFREALPPGTPAVILRVSDGGYLAVDLFFILSGYVIALNYGHWFAGTPFRGRRYARFLALRLSRIYPLHMVMLVLFLANPVAAFLFSHQHSPGDLRLDYYALSVVLMQAWGIVPGLTWNVPSWSISTEWFAYLLFPALAIAVFRLTGTVLRTAAFLCVTLAAFCLMVAALSPSGLGYIGQLFSLVRCVVEFSIGMALFRLDQGRERSRVETACALGLAVITGMAFVLLQPADFFLMPLTFTALIYGLSDERGLLPRLLRNPALQWLGVVSYSTYLSHYFLKIWTKFILVRPGISPDLPFPAYVCAVLVASALLYRLVERPGQRWLRAHADGLR